MKYILLAIILLFISADQYRYKYRVLYTYMNNRFKRYELTNKIDTIDNRGMPVIRYVNQDSATITRNCCYWIIEQ